MFYNILPCGISSGLCQTRITKMVVVTLMSDVKISNYSVIINKTLTKKFIFYMISTTLIFYQEGPFNFSS